jgi:glycosyltransferase involved in cell wall biosynthesis
LEAVQRDKYVLLFVDSLRSGGAQRQIVVLANELHRRGYRVGILTYYPGDQLSQFLRSPDIRCQLVVRRSTRDPLYPLRLYRHLRRESPDCMISYLTTPSFWARTVGRLAGVPRVITSERDVGLGTQRGIAWLERLLAHASSRIVANAHAIRRGLIELGIRGDRIDVVYNGVDLSLFSRVCEERRGATREALGVGPDELLILLPGRISEQKNHRLLVEAIPLLAPARGRVRVAFAGNELSLEIKGRLVDAIRAAGLEDSFLFLGPRSDMPELYSAADVVVLPSLWEGFPNVVIEAMACETPVVASDVSDNEVIIENGVTGYVFPSRSAEGLAKALDAVLRSTPEERRAMGRRGAARVRELCALDRFGDRYEALIEGRRLADRVT